MALFDELLMKMAQGQPLSPTELEELRQQARAVEEVKNAVKTWLTPGSADPQFGHVRANSGEFVAPPVSGGYFEFTGSPSPLTVANDTHTAVTFDNFFGKPSSYRVEGDKFYTLTPGKFYLFSGTTQWDTNASGRREAWIYAYNQDGVLQWGEALYSLTPNGSAEDYFPFSCPNGITFDNAYLQFVVFQNSGGDLDLLRVVITIFEVSYGF